MWIKQIFMINSKNVCKTDKRKRKKKTTQDTQPTKLWKPCFFFVFFTQHFHFIPLQKRGISRAPVKAETESSSSAPQTGLLAKQRRKRREVLLVPEKDVRHLHCPLSHAAEMQLYCKASAEARRCWDQVRGQIKNLKPQITEEKTPLPSNEGRGDRRVFKKLFKLAEKEKSHHHG